MTTTPPTDPRPTITRVLRDFFDAQFASMPPVRRERAVQIEHRLRAFLEAEGEQGLVTFDLVLLRTERQISPTGAFSRLMHADDLVVALPGFVADAWLPADPVDRRLQVRLAGQLLDHVIGRALIDPGEMACFVLEAEARISQAR
jgi:hypothetical protein